MKKNVKMKNLWLNYKKTKDIDYLIEACENAPFFGNPDMGKEIARLLEKIKN